MPRISQDLIEYANLIEHAWTQSGNPAEERNAAMPDGYIMPDIPPDAPSDLTVMHVLAVAGRSHTEYGTTCRCRNCTRVREFAALYPSGRDNEGRDYLGFDEDGYNSDGYDRNGYDSDGIDSEGYDREGYDEDGYNRDGYDSEGYDSGGYDREGIDAYGNYRDSGSGLEYYSYTPTLRFRGDNGPYYGMEIEVTTDYPGRLVDTVNSVAEPNLIYCKEDGSVAGAEMVTHPMSYDWAMANFPWQLLSALRNDADATVIPQENGIHIHVSRDGFDTPAHLLRWLKFWYRNPNDIQRIARRRENSWAEFSPTHRRSHIEHVKRHSRPLNGTAWDSPMRYNSEADETNVRRYSAINTQNDQTLEVRVFASTLRPQRAKAALQLVAGSVEYTRMLRSESVIKRHGWDWRAFIGWAAKDGRYPDLVVENRVRRGH